MIHGVRSFQSIGVQEASLAGDIPGATGAGLADDEARMDGTGKPVHGFGGFGGGR